MNFSFLLFKLISCCSHREIKVETTNMDSDMFFVGQKFECKEEVLIFFREFCNIYLQPFRIRNCSQERVVFKCCHGRKRKSTCTGERPNQSYLYKGCTAQINVYKGKRTYWVVTKVDLQHNHEISRAQYESYGRRRSEGKDYKLMSESVESEVCKVLNVLGKKFVTFLTRKDIQNIENKLFSESSEEREEELKNFLVKVVEENGACSVSYNDDGTLKALFIATEVMIINLRKSQPPVLQIEVFCESETENDKVLGFCYYSPVTAKSEFAALVFIFKDHFDIVKECLTEFRKLCVSDPFAFIINKDLMEILDVKDVFPSSVALLCQLQVLNHVKKLLSTALACHAVTKENVFQMFKKVLNSETEEEYDEKKVDLLVIANGVKVRAENNKYVFYNDEFDNNWDSCKEMWVHCYRKGLPLIGDSPNNQVERSFWALKNYVSATFCGVPNMCESIIALISFVMKRLQSSESDTVQKIFKIMDKNPKIRSSLGKASLRLNETGLRLFHKSLVSLWTYKSVKPKDEKRVLKTCKSYSTNTTSCSCTYWKSYEAPCQHILLLREILNSDLYSDDCFHRRYFHTENIDTNEDLAPEDISEVSGNDSTSKGNDDEMRTLADDEKFEKVAAITQEINELVTAHDTRQYLEYLEELQKFASFVRQGEAVAVTSLSYQNSRVTKLKNLNHPRV